MSRLDLSLLADLLVDELRKHCADPSPVRDASETALVDLQFRISEAFAEACMAKRITHSLGRLREKSWTTGDRVNDGLLVLGAYEHLKELKAQVAA